MTRAARRHTLPWVTADQMREVDRILVEEVGLQLVQMLENAGRHLAELAVVRFAPGSCTVLVGSGGNGGGGMVAARHLRNRGVDVKAVPVRFTPTGVPGQQLEVVYTADIGVPDWVYARVGVGVDVRTPFASGAIVATDLAVPRTGRSRHGSVG